MRAIKKIKSKNYNAGQGDTIELAELGGVSIPGGEVPHIAAIEILQDITMTTGAGGPVTSDQLHELLSSITVTADGPWGPVNLDGLHLAHLHFVTGGFGIPYASVGANGDTQIAASSNNATRMVRSIYSFENFGSWDDPFGFCPPIPLFAREGSIQLKYSALPANATVTTTVMRPKVHLVGRQKERTVPRVRTLLQALVGSGQALSEGGLMMKLGLVSESTDAVQGDFTGFRLYAGGQILDVDRPLDIYPKELSIVPSPKISNAFIQNHFTEQIGGGFVRAVNVWPHMPRGPLSDMPNGRFTYQFDGAPTIANWQVLYSVASEMDNVHMGKTLAGTAREGALRPGRDPSGKVVPPTHVLIPEGAQGSVATPSRLLPYLPRTPVPVGSIQHKIAAAHGLASTL